MGSQISLSPSRLSKISVVQSLLIVTVTFQVPTSCDGSKMLTVGLGGQCSTVWSALDDMLHHGMVLASWLKATA